MKARKPRPGASKLHSPVTNPDHEPNCYPDPSPNLGPKPSLAADTPHASCPGPRHCSLCASLVSAHGRDTARSAHRHESARNAQTPVSALRGWWVMPFLTLKKSAPIVARLLHTALRPPSYFCLAGAGCRADRDELRLSENIRKIRGVLAGLTTVVTWSRTTPLCCY